MCSDNIVLKQFLNFKFVRLLLTFFGVCDTRINQQPVSSPRSQQPPTAHNSLQQLVTSPNRLYSLDLLYFKQFLIMLFTCVCPLSNNSYRAGYFEPLMSSTMKKIGAAKKFVRHKYAYEYIMYIDYTHTYIKYRHIMYNMFVTYTIVNVA